MHTRKPCPGKSKASGVGSFRPISVANVKPSNSSDADVSILIIINGVVHVLVVCCPAVLGNVSKG